MMRPLSSVSALADTPNRILPIPIGHTLLQHNWSVLLSAPHEHPSALRRGAVFRFALPKSASHTALPLPLPLPQLRAHTVPT